MSLLKVSLLATFFLSAASLATDIASSIEDLSDLEPLDLNSYRSSRQFKQAAEDDGGVAIGLIDALQRWADALEAQISIMKNEVLGLKSSNRQLKKEVSRVREENDGLRSEVTGLRSQVQENQGNNVKDAGNINGKVEGMRNDLKVFSKSFSDFLEHYDTTMKEARTNNSVLAGQLDWVKKSVKDLSSTLGSSDHNVESVRSSLESLTNTVQVLTQTDYILEERVRNAENMTESFATSLNGQIMKMKSTLIDPSFVNEAISNLTHEINSLRANADLNMTTMAFSVKALEQTLTLALHNTTNELSASIGELTDFVERLHLAVKEQNGAVEEDFISFRKTIAFAKEKYDELIKQTEQFDLKLDTQNGVRNNFTQAVLVAMNEFGARLGDTENALENVKPQLDVINSSITTFIGQVGSEILNLQSKDDTMRVDIERLNVTVSQHEVTTFIHGNTTLWLREQVYRLEAVFGEMQGNTSRLEQNSNESSRNHTLMLGGLRALEKHFIDVKKDMFETKLNVVSINDTLNNMLGADLTRMRSQLTETNELFNSRLMLLETDSGDIRDDLGMLWNNTATLSVRVQGLAENLTDTTAIFNGNLDSISSLHLRQRKTIEQIGNKTQVLEVGLTGLMNYSVEVQANLSRLLVFAAENKAEILELKVADTSLEDKVDEIFDMHDIHTTRVTQTRGHVSANLTRLEGLTNALDAELDTMTIRYKTLENMFSNYVKSTGEMEQDVERLREDSVTTRNELDNVKFDLNSVKAESTGIDVFVTSIQNHISALTSNLTSVAANLTNARTDIKNTRSVVEQMDVRMDVIGADVTENRNGLILADEHFQILRLNSSTLKANILGLGNYINNINTDLGKLATTFEKYIGDITDNMGVLGENITGLEGALQDEASDIRTSIHGVELINTNLKGEIATLTTKTYTMKTNLFEQQNELSALKADSENLLSGLDKVEVRMTNMEAADADTEKGMASMRGDVSTLRTGLTSLTNSLFNLKAQILDVETVEGRMTRLSSNLTALTSDFEKVRTDMADVKPSVDRFSKDMNGLRQEVATLSTDVGDTIDPSRFSCAVTTDEIRKSGVITYNVCNVNKDELMNRETGHVSVKESGDYFLTFSANMVSVNAQAVWCALYKQSAGNEGWQVLGMINNYLRNAEKIDDRDSGSLTLITPLKAGDQIWVEWRGYGESFLYSNPYRLISFSGYMITKDK